MSPAKYGGIAVGVLEGPVTVRDHEGHSQTLQQSQLRPKELTEPLLGGDLPAAPLQASDPVLRLGVLRLPGVGRGDHQEPSVGQHFLKPARVTPVTRSAVLSVEMDEKQSIRGFSAASFILSNVTEGLFWSY